MISVTEATKFLQRDAGSATLVLPKNDVGALATVAIVVQRLDKFVRAAEKMQRAKSGGKDSSNSGGAGGGAGLLEAVVGVEVAKKIGSSVSRAFRFGARNALRGSGIVSGAFGAYSVYKDIKKSGRVGFANAAMTGAGIGLTIGSFFGGVGAVPGAILGGLLGSAVSGVYNKRRQIENLWKESLATATRYADAAKQYVVEKWNFALTTAKSYADMTATKIKQTWDNVYNTIIAYKDQATAWFSSFGVTLSEWTKSVGEYLSQAINISHLRAVAFEWLSKLKNWLLEKIGLKSGDGPGATSASGGSGGSDAATSLNNEGIVAKPSVNLDNNHILSVPQMPREAYVNTQQEQSERYPLAVATGSTPAVESGSTAFKPTATGRDEDSDTQKAYKAFTLPKLGGDRNTPSFVKEGQKGESVSVAREAYGNASPAPLSSVEKNLGSSLPIKDISNLATYQHRGEPLKSINGLIFHHTGGRQTPEGVVSTLNQRGLGVQYVMDRDGQIYQTLPEGTRGAHVRPSEINNLSNSNALGVEVIAKDDTDVAKAQVEAGVRFYRELKQKYPELQVFGHGEINSHKMRTEGATIVKAIREGGASLPKLDPNYKPTVSMDKSFRAYMGGDSDYKPVKKPQVEASPQPSSPTAAFSTPRVLFPKPVPTPKATPSTATPSSTTPAAVTPKKDATPAKSTLEEAGKASAPPPPPHEEHNKDASMQPDSSGPKHKKINIDSIPVVHPDVHLTVTSHSKVA